jgi:DNA sulfur modification protein DndC
VEPPISLVTSGGSTPEVAPAPAAAVAEIREQYAADDRPWVLGFSGGKDSTAALQLVWYALAGLPADARTKPVYVISGDTLVETPVIVDYLRDTLDRIGQAARDAGLPIETHLVVPETDESFWVSLIGRGYPAPSPRFRWCTERMKINPANRFILGRVAHHGEVTVVLGVRRQESATRAQVMSLRAIPGTRLSRHGRLPNAFVYTPVRDWSLDDVWTYLLQVPCPWGSDNQNLLSMYRQTSSDECPLVVDTTTPSCGSSRFGCWTCTVVTKDKAMEAMVDRGEEWLEPLLRVRDRLAETQDPQVKAVVRQHVRRDGRVMAKTIGDKTDPVVRGPYTMGFCREILGEVLAAEREAQAAAPAGQAVHLITDDELRAIRRIWRFERDQWDDDVPAIVSASSDRTLLWADEDVVPFDGDDEARLRALCAEQDVPVAMVKRLIGCERELEGHRRRADITARLNQTLQRDWRAEYDVLAEIVERDELEAA